MIRLRVTDLDAWVRFVEPEREEFEVSLDNFLAYMRREAPETPQMKAGGALHSILERASAGEVLGEGLAGIEQDGFTFYFGADASVAIPRERESDVEGVWRSSAGLVLLRGRVDARTAAEVVDFKLTEGAFDAERYADSLQWRAYLAMTGAKRFRYIVFQAKREDADVFVQDVHELTFWAYPEMKEEVARRVAELAEFVAKHVPALVEA